MTKKDKKPSMIEKVIKNKKISDDGFDKILQKIEKAGKIQAIKDEAFWSSERKKEIKAAAENWVSINGKLGDDGYQNPFLPALGNFSEVSREEFSDFIYLTIEKNQDKVRVDKKNPFENQLLEIDGFIYGVMHGQGSFYWLEPSK